MTTASKALRATARNYLKNQVANAEANKIESTPSIPPETGSTPILTQDVTVANGSEVKIEGDEQGIEDAAPAQIQKQQDQSEELMQSIEVSWNAGILEPSD